MRYISTFLVIFCLSINAFGQKHDYNWVFGAFEIGGEVDRKGNLLNFNEDIIQLELYEKEYMIERPNVTYSDSMGNLLFVSNGCSIYGADGETIENGDGLNPGRVADEFCEDEYNVAYSTDSQSMLALPNLKDKNECLLFHKRVNIENSDTFNDLLMTKILLGNGLSVSSKNMLIDSSHSSGLIAATKKTNQEGWWIVSPKRYGKIKVVTSITGSVVDSNSYQNIGIEISTSSQATSYSSFSPDGSILALYGEDEGIQLFNFDRTSGVLSNYNFIEDPNDFGGGYVGLAFSASGRFLYTCHWKKIYQYDMWRADIEESVVVMDWEESYDDFFGYETPFFRMERGPDCRIYLSAHNSTNTIHVIHHPDRKGVACGLQQNIKIPAYNLGTFPSYPNYRLGTGAVCDSTKLFPTDLISAIEPSFELDRIDNYVSVYPNPARESFSLEFYDFQKGLVEFRLYDPQGKEVYQQNFIDPFGQQQINDLNLPAGIYFYRLSTVQGTLQKGKLVLVE